MLRMTVITYKVLCVSGILYLALELPGVPHFPQQGSKPLYQHRLAAAVVVRQQKEVPERQHSGQRLQARTDVGEQDTAAWSTLPLSSTSLPCSTSWLQASGIVEIPQNSAFMMCPDTRNLTAMCSSLLRGSLGTIGRDLRCCRLASLSCAMGRLRGAHLYNDVDVIVAAHIVQAHQARHVLAAVQCSHPL